MNARSTALRTHRRRLKEAGVARLEVRAARDDVPLIRAVAEALADPGRAAATRAMLRRNLIGPGAGGLKALLASAPLEGVDLDRDRGTGREVDL